MCGVTDPWAEIAEEVHQPLASLRAAAEMVASYVHHHVWVRRGEAHVHLWC